MRAQISMQIILAVIILLIVIIVLNQRPVSEEKLQIEQQRLTQITPLESSVRGFLNSCIKNELEDALFLMGFQAGYIEIPKNVPRIPAFYTEVPLWFKGNLDLIPGKQVMEQEIANYLSEYLIDCADNLTIPGYSLEFGATQSEITINQDSVVALVTFPVIVQGPGVEKRINQFIVESPIRLGRIMQETEQFIEKHRKNPTAIDITELSQLTFSTTVYDHNNLTKIIVLRDKDSIVKNEPYQFSIGIELMENKQTSTVELLDLPRVNLRVGESVTVEINVSNPQNQPLTFSIISNTLDIDESTGVLTITGEEEGIYTPIITVTNPQGISDFDSLFINITP